MKSQTSVILMLVISSLISTFAVAEFKPITNVNDPHVQGVAKWAVGKHNIDANTNLIYVRVVKGDIEHADGRYYRLTISAKDNGVIKQYLAAVAERTSENIKSLTAFVPL
ncbi:Cysteine proteinase inhibitor [Thalictrum thalictroides]|uniref:Cysteine proteinase inhibitor n=1 Tax=Thalictrum thalictroides TaxID=46969 RepID=A0A7J6XGT5_THATH|nr:Cysteine proteinase inhibitor [Thalictrum thalictroides]